MWDNWNSYTAGGVGVLNGIITLEDILTGY